MKNRSWLAVVSLLHELKSNPMCAQELSRSRGWDLDRSRRWLVTLHDCKWAHISGWTRFGIRGAHVPVYSFGPGSDVASPGKRAGYMVIDMTLRANRLTEVRHVLRMLDALKARATSSQELAETFGSGRSAVNEFLRGSKKIGLIRVAAWGRSGHNPVALWALGSEEDAERPRSKPVKIVRQEYKARLALPHIRTRLAANVPWIQAAA